MRLFETRRLAPRIEVDGLCGVVTDGELTHATMVDLSAIGLCIELPHDLRATGLLQLEIELPGVDEIVWASGQLQFAQVSPILGVYTNGKPRRWCRAGVQIERVARRDRSMIREYVIETRRARQHSPGDAVTR